MSLRNNGLVQGHLAAEACKKVAVLCVMMDLLVTCDSSALIKVLCTGLVTQPDILQDSGSKRARKPAGKKRAKASDAPALDVRIFMLGA
jgi:hypothetical protein